MTFLQNAGLPHSGISGSSLVCQLPEAYRRLLRPSSPPSAKASTIRPSLFELSNQTLVARSSWSKPETRPCSATHVIRSQRQPPLTYKVVKESESQQAASDLEGPRDTTDRVAVRRRRASVSEKQAAATSFTSLGQSSEDDHRGSLKEVIQPQVPLRLPCYDFTPIIDQTVGASLPWGWVNDFGSSQLSWCDGRCVQGPGTYSPRHSDARLLAIPTSWSRVADSNLN